MQQLRIGIDCRLGGIRHAGIGRYISEYLQQLATRPDLRLECLFHDQQQADELLSKLEPKDRTKVQVTLAAIAHYSVDEQLKLPKIFNSWQIDLLHVPHFNVPIDYHRPFVVTIHDLLWHSTRGAAVTTLKPLAYWPKYAAYRWLVGTAVRRAAKVFVPTAYVADEVSRYYPHAKDKLLATYEGVGKQFTPDTSVERASKTLLYVGSLYPHKNIDIVFQALQMVPELQLQIISARNVFTDQTLKKAGELGISRQVTFLGNCSDEQLLAQYRQATAVIQPSLSEGFGLTGVEALATGTPVLASDIPVFHEVYQQAALFFDPHSAQTLVATINHDLPELVTDKTWQAARAAALEKCSWHKMTTEILQAMRQLTGKQTSL
jgi:glycosyltransferase involved in cell wall biosynthesis